MSKQSNSFSKANVKHDLDERALEIAKAADRWFCSLSRDLGKAARWGKDEIGLWADSARRAAGTTKKITKKMARRLKRNQKPSSGAEALLHELGALIAERSADEYQNLRYDVEFWTLVKRLHALGRKVGQKAAAGKKPGLEKAKKVSRKGPEEDSRELGEEVPKKAAVSRKNRGKSKSTSSSRRRKTKSPSKRR